LREEELGSGGFTTTTTLLHYYTPTRFSITAILRRGIATGNAYQQPYSGQRAIKARAQEGEGKGKGRGAGRDERPGGGGGTLGGLQMGIDS